MRIFPRLSLRYEANRLLLYVLVSFGATVVLTRAYLQVTGYPQVGHGNLHIAHLLWGGLAMAIAGIVLLIFATPRVYGISAMLVGIGIGLFIDEVGKFITIDNNYFFRPAAPIIYVCFLAVALIYFAVAHRQKSEERLMIAALERAQALVEGPMSDQAHAELQLWLAQLSHAHSPGWTQLAAALEEFAAAQQVHNTWLSRFEVRMRRLQLGLQVFFETHMGLITTLIIGIVSLRALSGVIILISTIAVNVLPDSDIIGFFRPGNGIGIWLQAVTSALMLVGLVLYFAHRRRAGLFWLQTAMVLALTVVGVVAFYANQFAATINMLTDLFVWLVLHTYTNRLLMAEVRIRTVDAHATHA